MTSRPSLRSRPAPAAAPLKGRPATLEDAALSRPSLARRTAHTRVNVLCSVKELAFLLEGTARGGSHAERLAARLDALATASAQAVRAAEPEQGACAAALVEAVLTEARAKRVWTSGPRDLRLTTQAADMLALAVHELCLNAREHGALSDAPGRVTCHWGWDPEARGEAYLEWTETGAPNGPRGAPAFGQLVLDRMAPAAFGSRAVTSFQGGQLHYRLPLRRGVSQAG